MKTMATAMNLYVPPDLRESQPFLAAFAVGLCCSPILNVPRVLQLNKISGTPYPETFRNFFLSPSGWMKYAQTTTDPAFKGMGFGSVLKETITPAYAARCFA